jgi:peptidylprolyl isomerase
MESTMIKVYGKVVTALFLTMLIAACNPVDWIKNGVKKLKGVGKVEDQNKESGKNAEKNRSEITEKSKKIINEIVDDNSRRNNRYREHESAAQKNISESRNEEIQQKDDDIEYSLLKRGEGSDSPKDGDTAIVHYTGWLSEKGKKKRKFDSSLDRGVPFGFKVGTGSVIKGFEKAVKRMRVGDKASVVIPAKLAYGSRGVPRVIPPDSELTFELELVKVVTDKKSA